MSRIHPHISASPPAVSGHEPVDAVGAVGTADVIEVADALEDPSGGAPGGCPAVPSELAGVPGLAPEQEAAWVGFLVAHTEIMRALDAGLAAEFGLSVSALEVLARMIGENEGRMRISDLAHGALLSPSRVSRLVGQLELRGLVERTSCPSDSRGVFALITPSGRELTTRALTWHAEQVRLRFFSDLDDRQIGELGEIWRKVLDEPPAGNACTGRR